ncbi:MAG: FecR domain-containing protein [Puniceicoccales bacterium]|jgi:hypothetical protein|nr:FecR domain-containing protein [Puniceicoccales bacterium]
MKSTSESKALLKAKSFLGCVATPVSTSIRASFIAAALAVGAVTAAAAMQQGQIEVGSVRGNVTASFRNGEASPLQTGSMVNSGVKVACGRDSTAELLLANGSRVIVQPNTELLITKFDIEPTGSVPSAKFDQLSAEPSFSSTLLNMERGKIIVEVRKLKVPVSDFKIRTPFLTADVKGTAFYVEQSNTYAKVGNVVGSVAVSPLLQLGAPVVLQQDQMVIYRLGEGHEESQGGLYGRVQPIDPTERQDASNQLSGGDPSAPGSPMPSDEQGPDRVKPEMPIDNSIVNTSPNGESQHI